MNKWALLTVTGFLGCSASLSAQERQRSVPFTLSQPGRIMAGSNGDLLRTLSNSSYTMSAPMLLDGRRLSLSNAYTWIDPMPVDFLPAETEGFSASVSTGSPSVREDSDGKTVPVQRKLVDYVHGEVGVLYGSTVGSNKFSREVEQGYILGEIGNDKYQINVGAFYEHSSGHVPRFGR
jgi:hypothetical protein